MDEKDQKIQEMEQRLEAMQREVDTLKQSPSPYRYDNRKRLKPWKIALIALGCIAALVAAVLAVVFTLMNSDKQSPAMAEELIHAIVEQDADAAYSLTYPGALERDAFDQGFEEMCAVWRAAGGGDTFDMKRTRWSMNSSNGTTQYTSGYRITSGGVQFSFELTRVTQGNNGGLVEAHISPLLP